MSLDMNKLNALLGQVVGDVGAAMSSALVLVGDRLGLYRALASGPQTPDEVASRAGCSGRMVREWLLNQAAGGYVMYDPGSGTYSMTPQQVAAFADEKGPASMLGAFQIITSVHRDIDKIEEAMRSGKGMPWGAHDACLFCGTERFFAAGYRANLIDSWLPALNGVVEKMKKGAAVADIGCGHGASTILMAKAFGASKFDGFDFHAPSIACAQQRAAEAGASNVKFAVADAARFAPSTGMYDVVACFDCLHDMTDPVACAKSVKASLKPGGVWMVVEPAAADTVEGNCNPVARVFSAASTAICVPASMAGNGPALGACAGPAKIQEVIRAGGFRSVRIATQTPFNLIYEAIA